MKSNSTVILLIALILSGCSSINNMHKAPAKEDPRGGLQKTARGSAVIDGVPGTAGIIRVSQIDGRHVRFQSEDFAKIGDEILYARDLIIGVSTGPTELKIEFFFMAPQGGGYVCRSTQLLEIADGHVYKPMVEFDADSKVFTSWIIDVKTGETLSEPVVGEWTKMDTESFAGFIGERLGMEDGHYNPLSDRNAMSDDYSKSTADIAKEMSVDPGAKYNRPTVNNSTDK